MDNKSKDELFNNEIKKSFDFDDNVARVFDDMLVRSIPFYEETLKLCTSICIANTKPTDIIYDIGCSTANTLINIKEQSKHTLSLIGIDNSSSMIKRAKEKINAYGYDILLIKDDIFNVDLKEANIILLNYTLQFIRPIQRQDLLKKIFNSLQKDGVMLCSEKLISEDKILNKQLIDEYLLFKTNNGYSKTQIMQKRQALENILIPYTMKENIDMFYEAGFSKVDVIFRWANFATFFARK